MRAFAAIALAGVSMAVDTATLNALMQVPKFGHQNSNNNDSDIKRVFPDFANDYRKGMERQPTPEEERMGRELIPIAVRNRQAAIKDPVLAKRPRVREFPLSYAYEPIEHPDRVYESPVFLVDPKFTEKTPDDQMQCFMSNDYSGWNQPVSVSRFPILSKEVMHFFHVGPTCT